jgi:hypothetical protein
MRPNAPGVLRDASGRRVCRVEQAVDVVAHDAVDPQATQASDVRSTLRAPREDEPTDGMHQPDASCREDETHFRSHRPGNAPPLLAGVTVVLVPVAGRPYPRLVR